MYLSFPLYRMLTGRRVRPSLRHVCMLSGVIRHTAARATTRCTERTLSTHRTPPGRSVLLQVLP
jgi:hypothetical protein